MRNVENVFTSLLKRELSQRNRASLHIMQKCVSYVPVLLGGGREQSRGGSHNIII